MRLESWRTKAGQKCLVRVSGGLAEVEAIALRARVSAPIDMQGLLSSGALSGLNVWLRQGEVSASDLWVPSGEDRPGPLLSRPSKIFGIGLNYAAHAKDLSEKTPAGLPGGFMKPATTIVGHGDPIVLPAGVGKVTGEAELGLLIGSACKDVPEASWRDVVAGFTPILDMTAEDILRQNPRYLTLSKSFDTFLVLGFELVTCEEIGALAELRVETVLNGTVVAEGSIAQMTFGPGRLVALLSRVMTLLPGDVILTGTPGAVALGHGDVLSARISGFQSLESPVIGPLQEDA